MKTKRRLRFKIISILSVLLFIIIWYLITDIFKIIPKTSLPSPILAFKTFILKWTVKAPDGALLGQHIFASLQVALLGFVLGCVVGIPLGVLMAWYKGVDRIVKPVFDFLRTIPSIAWIPIMIILFGIGVFSKACVVFFGSFIPCVINSYSGVEDTKRVHIWVGQTFGASSSANLRKIALPSALPMIITGMKISLNASWASLLAAEMLGSSNGLGFLIQIGRIYCRSDIIIVGMVVIGFIGFCFSTGLDYLYLKFVKGN